MYTHNPTRSCVNATQYARARSKGTSTKRKDGFLAKNPPNERTPRSPTHAHFALLADGSSVDRYEGGVRHLLLPGQQILLPPLAIHLFVNLCPSCSVGTNFECPASATARDWLSRHAHEPWHKAILQMLHV